MGNPIALVLSLSPRRLVAFVLGALLGWGALVVTSVDLDDEQVTDASDVTRVELLQ